MSGPTRGLHNPRLQRAAREYAARVGCSEKKAARLVREALGVTERPAPSFEGSGPGEGVRGPHAPTGAAQRRSASMSAVGGAKTDRAGEAAVIMDRHGLDGYVREYRFHPVRLWRLDFFWPDSRVALEIEGRLPPWVDGNQVSHHTSWTGYESDCEKYSEAAVAGIRVIRCTQGMMRDGRMVDLVGRALCGEGWSE